MTLWASKTLWFWWIWWLLVCYWLAQNLLRQNSFLQYPHWTMYTVDCTHVLELPGRNIFSYLLPGMNMLFTYHMCTEIVICAESRYRNQRLFMLLFSILRWYSFSQSPKYSIQTLFWFTLQTGALYRGTRAPQSRPATTSTRAICSSPWDANMGYKNCVYFLLNLNVQLTFNNMYIACWLKIKF